VYLPEEAVEPEIPKLEDEKRGGEPCLKLPEQVTLIERSSAGPFARAVLKARPATVPLTNVTSSHVTVAPVDISPLADARTGLVPETGSGTLSAAPAKLNLEPGEATVIRITGFVPARPGTYVAQLHVTTQGGQAVHAPISIAVAASPAWGIGCMVFGLILLGLLKLLTGEGNVEDKLREVAQSRGEIHAWVQRDPPPERRADELAEIDHDLDDADRALAGPRRLSVVDRRIPMRTQLWPPPTRRLRRSSRSSRRRRPGYQWKLLTWATSGAGCKNV
jgi:hypothetical protein